MKFSGTIKCHSNFRLICKEAYTKGMICKEAYTKGMVGSGASIYCPLWSPFWASTQGFKTRMLERGFHTLIKNASVSSLTNVGSHNPPPSGSSVLRDPASSLAHHSVSDSDTVCNGPSPPLANIVLFGLSLLGYRSKF